MLCYNRTQATLLHERAPHDISNEREETKGVLQVAFAARKRGSTRNVLDELNNQKYTELREAHIEFIYVILFHWSIYCTYIYNIVYSHRIAKFVDDKYIFE